MAEYIRISEAANRLGCSPSTLHQSRIGMAAQVPGTRPKLVDWEMLRGTYVLRSVGRPRCCRPVTNPAAKINPYWLRRGDTGSLSSRSSSLEAGAVYL